MRILHKFIYAVVNVLVLLALTLHTVSAQSPGPGTNTKQAPQPALETKSTSGSASAPINPATTIPVSPTSTASPPSPPPAVNPPTTAVPGKEHSSARPAAPAMASSKTSVATPASAPLTSMQIEAFSAVVKQPPALVQQQIEKDPVLANLAATAADERMSRKSTGTVMTVVGFTILGVGDIAGAVIILLTPGYPNVQGHEGQFFLGLGIGVVTFGAGLAIGIPGLIKLIKRSKAETKALDYYKSRHIHQISSGPRAVPLSPPAVSFSAPLLTLSF